MKKKRPSTKEAIKGTWEYSENYSTMKITSGNTPYKIYFSVVKGIIRNAENTARITVYGDSNSNGAFDASDAVIGDATTKTYVAGTSGTKGTFEGSLKSNVTYSYVDGKKVGESTFDKSAWTPIQAAIKTASKKNKPIKTPKSVGTKDPITGARWDLDGYELVSDKVYTGLATPFDSMMFTDSSWDKSVEVEFGNPRFIVFNYKHTYINGIDSTTRASFSQGEVTARQVWEGEFKYADNRLTTAKLQRVSYDQLTTTTYINGQTPPYTRTNGYVSKQAKNSGGIAISDPSSLVSWSPAIIELTGGGSGEIQSYIADAYYGEGGPYHTAAESEAGVWAYQSGRFFADGW